MCCNIKFLDLDFKSFNLKLKSTIGFLEVTINIYYLVQLYLLKYIIIFH